MAPVTKIPVELLPPHFTVGDGTTGLTTVEAGETYTGPVGGLATQYLNITPDNLNIVAGVPNTFIHSGFGDDAIDVSRVNGDNVLDGGTGSNFLVGGTGKDTFFVDTRGGVADTWSTVANFHSGDAATIWGIVPGNFDLSWVEGQGAADHTGLTLHAKLGFAHIPSNHLVQYIPPVNSLTLAGFTSADLTNGKLTVSYGQAAPVDGFAGSSYMYIHAN